MIEIKVTEKDDRSFDVDFKVRSTDSETHIQQVEAILNELYHAEEKCFENALFLSDFGKKVMSK